MKMLTQYSESDQKKYSKVSAALRRRFFILIYVDQLSIKEAAKICQLNYSTAKSLMKGMSQRQEKYITQEVNSQKKPQFHRSRRSLGMKQCSYKKIKNCSQASLPQVKEECQSSTAYCFMPVQKNIFSPLIVSQSSNRICITSTVGFDFFQTTVSINDGEQKVKAQSNPFEYKKPISSVVQINSRMLKKKERNDGLLGVPKIDCEMISGGGSHNRSQYWVKRRGPNFNNLI